MHKKIVLEIIGKVQGVLYRVNTMNKAKELNLTGYVKNNKDGTVEIIAEGEENNLKNLIIWCYQGSPNANVEKIKENWKNYIGDFNSFEIKH